MNRRKVSKGIHRSEHLHLEPAWLHARVIGLPLNAHVVINPIGMSDLQPGARADLFADVREKLRSFCAYHAVSFAAIWAREVSPGDSNEHMHVLMHVPDRLRARFEANVSRWFSDAGEVDVSDATYRRFRMRNGAVGSAVGYIGKQMTPQAKWQRPVTRQPGGEILGKRAGWTGNLSPASIEVWMKARCKAA